MQCRVPAKAYSHCGHSPLTAQYFNPVRAGCSGSENLQMDGQVFLRIFSDRGEQIAHFNDRLIRIVVQCRVLQRLANASLSTVNAVHDVGKTSHRVIKLACKLFAIQRLTDRAVARIDSVQRLIDLSYSSIAIVEKARILYEPWYRAGAFIDVIC